MGAGGLHSSHGEAFFPGLIEDQSEAFRDGVPIGRDFDGGVPAGGGDLYIYYIIYKFPLPACADCSYGNNGSKFNTIDNTNTNDRVYKIYTAYKIYNMYISLIK